MPSSKKRSEPVWYWIEGLTKRSGVKRWVPLYNSRDPQKANTMIRMIRHQLANPPKDQSKSQSSELAALKRMRDFRVVADTEPAVNCDECGSNYLKRIKREGSKLWKCRNCGHVWPRKVLTPEVKESKKLSEASRKLSKPRKQQNRSNNAPKQTSKAQERSERPVKKKKRKPQPR